MSGFLYPMREFSRSGSRRVGLACLVTLALGLTTGCGEDSDPEPSSGAGVAQVDDTRGPDFQWTGNGQRPLGTIRVKEPSVLRWRNDTGSSFGLGYDADYIDGPDHVEDFVDTAHRTGSVPVEAGVYRHIYMSAAAVGDWEITIEPR